jgi:hypothetical protein
MPLKRIRLELARNPDFPNGSRHHGYEFVAPLDDSEHLVAAEWAKDRDRCSVKRFWAGQPNELGKLIHRRGGAWVFDYNPATESDDEPGFKFDKHRFVPGEYVSITEHDHVQRAFRVASVEEIA